MNERSALTTSLATWADKIESGDIVLFRNPNSWIAQETDGPFSHAGMIVVCEGRLCIAEALQWHYPAITPLADQVAKWPGLFDIQRPRCAQFIRSKAAWLAVGQCGPGHAYNYLGVCKASCRHSIVVRPIARRFMELNPALDFMPDQATPKFCSEMVEWCYRSAGFPCVKHRAVSCVEPNHFDQSALVEPLFARLVP